MGLHFFGVDNLTGNLYAMKANSMALIPEKATIMPQVSDTNRTCHWIHARLSVLP